MDTGFADLIGEKLDHAEIRRHLKAYGCHVAKRGKKMSVSTLSYRDDYLHPVDVVEDFAISRGYQAFAPEPPTGFNIGGFCKLTEFSDKVRTLLVGFGFVELFSNVLVNKTELRDNMLLSGPLVEIDNVMVENYAVLRDSLLPALLKLEKNSQRALYPHHLFEVGEAAIYNEDENLGSQTITLCSMLLAHPKANFSELHSYLDNLGHYIGSDFSLHPLSLPSFIEGRAGKIILQKETCGQLGELHPALLEKWDIKVPCAACEVNLSKVLNLLTF